MVGVGKFAKITKLGTLLLSKEFSLKDMLDLLMLGFLFCGLHTTGVPTHMRRAHQPQSNQSRTPDNLADTLDMS